MKNAHTPSFTRSPSTCDGKLLCGAFSHSRICSRWPLASALSLFSLSIFISFYCNVTIAALGVKRGSAGLFEGEAAMPAIEAIRSEQLPPPVGPFSPAIRYGGFIFFSGQIGVDPARGGALVGGGIEDETR